MHVRSGRIPSTTRRRAGLGVVMLLCLGAACGGLSASVGGGDDIVAPTASSSTTDAGGIEDGGPGSCRILEGGFCGLGEPVVWANGYRFVGFSLPAGTNLFAFGAGEAVEMWWSPDPSSTGDDTASYPGVAVALATPEGDVRDATLVFMNRDAPPDVHLVSLDQGEWIGTLTPESLPTLPGGIVDGDYNLLVFLGDFDTASWGAFRAYFEVTFDDWP